MKGISFFGVIVSVLAIISMAWVSHSKASDQIQNPIILDDQVIAGEDLGLAARLQNNDGSYHGTILDYPSGGDKKEISFQVTGNIIGGYIRGVDLISCDRIAGGGFKCTIRNARACPIAKDRKGNPLPNSTDVVALEGGIGRGSISGRWKCADGRADIIVPDPNDENWVFPRGFSARK